MTQEPLTHWEELDWADRVVITYRHIANPGAEPGGDHWAELLVYDVDWTAAWLDRQVSESTYEPGERGPAFIMERHKTRFSWGADASQVEILVHVADDLFEFALAAGLPRLAKAINERLNGRPASALTLEDAIRIAQQRIAVRADVSIDSLVMVSSVERTESFEVVLRAPDGAVYTVEVGAEGPHTQRVEVRRTYSGG